jgi:hypothetical protein
MGTQATAPALALTRTVLTGIGGPKSSGAGAIGLVLQP